MQKRAPPVATNARQLQVTFCMHDDDNALATAIVSGYPRFLPNKAELKIDKCYKVLTDLSVIKLEEITVH